MAPAKKAAVADLHAGNGAHAFITPVTIQIAGDHIVTVKGPNVFAVCEIQEM